MARLVIVAGPASRPFRHLHSFCSPHRPGLSLWQVPPCSQHSQSSSIPSLYPPIGQPHTTSHVRPGLSLWQVPPYNQHPLFTSIPYWYPTPVTHTVTARLAIVAGPAFRPFRHLPSFCSPQWPGLSLWQVPPCSQHSQSSPIPSLYPITGQPHTTSHVRPGLSLWLVPPYNQHPLFTSIPSLYPTPVTSTVKARLVIVAGPAFRPFRHLPPFCSPQWPGLSLWQVPPCSQHAQSSSIPSLYPIIG